MDRIVNKARGFKAAQRWDIEQQTRMTPRERWSVARQLRQRTYGHKTKDVRACHPTE